jgi:hypothetical protein
VVMKSTISSRIVGLLVPSGGVVDPPTMPPVLLAGC